MGLFEVMSNISDDRPKGPEAVDSYSQSAIALSGRSPRVWQSSSKKGFINAESAARAVATEWIVICLEEESRVQRQDVPPVAFIRSGVF